MTTGSENRPRINGLVLAGGRSTHMVTDKGLIEYQGKPHRDYLYELLKSVCAEVYLSVRLDQVDELSATVPVIVDEDLYKGPYNGLLSAHHYDPDAAWMVLATDLSLIGQKTIELLAASRGTNCFATAYATTVSKKPEPLCAIWEPVGLSTAEMMLQKQDVKCPRKFLRTKDVTLVYPENDYELHNANVPEDRTFSINKLMQS